MERRQSLLNKIAHALKPACGATSSSGGGLNRLVLINSAPNGEVVAQATEGVSTQWKVESGKLKIYSSPNGEGREGCQPASSPCDSSLPSERQVPCHCEPRSGVAIQCPKYLDSFVCPSLLTPHPSPLPKEREKPVTNLTPLSQSKTWRTPPC